MGILGGLTSMFQGYQEWSSKDEIIFGEIVRLFVTKGQPVITFAAQEGRQSARFLLQNDVLFSLTVTLDQKIGSASLLSMTAEVRNKLADPDDMIEMFKTDFGNLTKIPLFGQIKVNHEYNTIYAHVSAMKSLNTYMGEKVGDVKTDVLSQDLDQMVQQLTDSLRKYKKS